MLILMWWLLLTLVRRVVLIRVRRRRILGDDGRGRVATRRGSRARSRGTRAFAASAVIRVLLRMAFAANVAWKVALVVGSGRQLTVAANAADDENEGEGE